jgi:UDP-N-acetylglucosamine--N-acetylmuramyl-(pentapeptide) pyrophosphoryl-undecaprenol N-acetylglucosamine transferase
MPLIKDFNADRNAVVVTGTPVRKIQNYDNFAFPDTIDKNRRTILICGGSQGAMSMNKALVKAVKWFSQNDFQVIWQTGSAGENEIKNEFDDVKNVAVFATFTDLYPYYSIAKFLIGRAGASTISEARLFALPSIFIPLPWSAENHQYHNAQYAQKSGWALCFEQNEEASDKIISFMETCEKDVEIYKKMKNCATENAADAAKIIAKTVLNNN